MLRTFVYFLVGAAAVLASNAFAETLPDDVLAKSRWTELTRADYEQSLANVPAKRRTEFSSSPRRVQGILNNLLVTKTLAAQARAHGTRPIPVGPKGVGTQEERQLAAGEIARIESDASRDFDAKKAEFEAKAREIYDVDHDKYQAPEEVRFSDVAVEIKDRGEEAALSRAQEVRKRLIDGEDFAKIAREYSDDPTTREKGGAIPFVSRERLEKEYAAGVFALTRIGEISQPIKGRSAYHVVRLDERRPPRQLAFDEVRDRIMQTLRQRYIAEQRDARLAAINSDPTLEVNQPAIDALVTHIDPELLKKADPRKPKSASSK
jgi:peptidyl-prolyl cis-trans isomerase C